jgi:acyl-CoA reductase-like NAD-dependent aldehyde dehydrogenase
MSSTKVSMSPWLLPKRAEKPVPNPLGVVGILSAFNFPVRPISHRLHAQLTLLQVAVYVSLGHGFI